MRTEVFNQTVSQRADAFKQLWMLASQAFRIGTQLGRRGDRVVEVTVRFLEREMECQLITQSGKQLD